MTEQEFHQALRERGEQILACIETQLLQLAAHDYPTDSPREFVTYLRGIVDGLRASLAGPSTPSLAQLICQFAKGFASHLRFVESASYPRVPWALISPMEQLISRVAPGSRVLLRVQWSYNYTIRSVSDQYRRALEALPHAAFPADFFSDTNRWFVIGLPNVDRHHVLLHVILGHEIGHQLADRFLAAENSAALQQELAGLVGDGRWYDPQIDRGGPLFSLQVRTELAQNILRMRHRGLQELLSDVTGACIFGPSFLFAMRELSLDDRLDAMPQSDSFYPPWRFRYRTVLAVQDELSYSLEIESLKSSPDPIVAKVIDATMLRLNGIRTLAASDADTRAISNIPVAARAYQSITRALPDGIDFVRRELGDLLYDRARIATRLPGLIDAALHGVPPSAVPHHEVDFRDVLLASSLCRLARLPIPLEGDGQFSLADYSTLERLTHKALEYVTIVRAFEDWKGKG